MSASDWTLADSPSSGGNTLSVGIINVPAGATSFLFHASNNGGLSFGADQTLPGGIATGARDIQVLAAWPLIPSTVIEIWPVGPGGEGAVSAQKTAIPSFITPTFAVQPTIGPATGPVGQVFDLTAGTAGPACSYTVEVLTLGAISKVSELTGDAIAGFQWDSVAEPVGTISWRVRATQPSGVFVLSNTITASLTSTTEVQLFSSVDTTGWRLQWPATPPTFAPLTNPAQYTVARAGFDESGAAVTVLETHTAMKRIRQASPNQTTLTALEVAASEYIYSTDTFPAGATNSSTWAAPLVQCLWLNRDMEWLTNGQTHFRAKLAVNHAHMRNGKPVAIVKMIATDGTNSVTVTANLVKGYFSTSGLYGQYYEALIPVATLNAAAIITVDAECYPWVGTMFRASTQGDTYPSINFCTLKFLNDKTGSFGTSYAYVDPAGSNVTGVVSATPATAAALPFQTLNAAATAIKAFNLLTYSRNSTSGGIARLNAGAFAHAIIATAAAITAGSIPFIVEASNSANKASTFYDCGATQTLSSMPDGIVFRNITIRLGTNTDIAIFDNNPANASFTKMMAFEGITWNLNGFDKNAIVVYRTGRCWMHDNNGDNCGQAETSGELNKCLIPIGCLGHYIDTRTFHAFGTDDSTFNCKFSGKDAVTQRAAAVGSFLGYCRLSTTNGGNSMVTIANVTGPRGFAMQCNIFEFWGAAPSASAGWSLSGDSHVGTQENVVVCGNTLTGSRANVLYNDSGVAAVLKRGYIFNNIIMEFNNKGDCFAPADGNRTGAMSVAYHVSFKNNFYIRGGNNGVTAGQPSGTDRAWLGELVSFSEITGNTTTQIFPGFVDDNSFITAQPGSAAVAGTGAGIYQLLATTTAPVLPANTAWGAWDIYGEPILNDGTGRAGAGQVQVAPTFAIQPTISPIVGTVGQVFALGQGTTNVPSILTTTTFSMDGVSKIGEITGTSPTLSWDSVGETATGAVDNLLFQVKAAHPTNATLFNMSTIAKAQLTPNSSATVVNQTARFPSETPALEGEWRPYDIDGNWINLDPAISPVVVSGGGGLTFSVGTLNGLRMNGVPAGANGAVVTVKPVGFPAINATIDASMTGRALVSATQLQAAYSLSGPSLLSGRTMILRGGRAFSMLGFAYANKHSGLTSVCTWEGEHKVGSVVLKPSVNTWAISATAPTTTGKIKLKNLRLNRAQNPARRTPSIPAYYGGSDILFITRADDVTIEDCDIHSDNTDSAAGGLLIENLQGIYATASVTNLTITGCEIHHIATTALILATVFTFDRNRIHDYWQDGIDLSSGARNGSITNNRIEGGSGWGSMLHSDLIQFQPNGATAMADILIAGNVGVPGPVHLKKRTGANYTAYNANVAVNTALTVAVHGCRMVVATVTGLTLTLPDAAAAIGVTMIFKYTPTTGSVTINAAGADTHTLGQLPKTLTPASNFGGEWAIRSNGTQWEPAEIGLRNGVFVVSHDMAFTNALWNTRILMSDAATGNRTHPLPAGVAGEIYHTQKWDGTSNTTTITCQPGETINYYGQTMTSFTWTGRVAGYELRGRAGGYDMLDHSHGQQGAPYGNQHNGGYANIHSVGNLWVVLEPHGSRLEEAVDGLIYESDTVVRLQAKDRNGDGRVLGGDGWYGAAVGNIKLRGVTVGRQAVAARCISSGLVDPLDTGTVAAMTFDNISMNLGQADATNVSASAALFAGLTGAATVDDFIVTTCAEALTAYLAKAGGALDGTYIGALGTTLTNGYWNFTTGIRNPSAPSLRDVTVPLKFQDSWWSVGPTGNSGEVAFTINTLPWDGNLNFADMEFTSNGTTWTSFGAMVTGTYARTGFTDGVAYPFNVRMRNSLGGGAVGTAKTRTPAVMASWISTASGPSFASPGNIAAAQTKLFMLADFAPLASSGTLFSISGSPNLRVEMLTNGSLRVNLRDGGGNVLLNNVATVAGTWVAGVRAVYACSVDMVAGFLKLFIDGVLVRSWSFTPVSSTIPTGRVGVYGLINTAYKGGTNWEAGVWLTASGAVDWSNGVRPTTDLLKLIAGNAAVVNADAWKLGANAT